MDSHPATPAKPTPPRKPEPNECCGTGCIPCVMDLYEEDLQRYEEELAAWNKAQRETYLR
jgi:hypothetical protein